MRYEDYLERIAHRSTDRYDTSALATDPDVFEAITRDLVASTAVAADRVAGIDALGFVFGAAVARELDVGFTPIRKGGKLPLPTEDVLAETATDYTGSTKTLEVDREAIRDDERVLLVDDWIETAGQMTAAADLVERAGGTVAGIVVLDAQENDASRRLDERYGLFTVSGKNG